MSALVPQYCDGVDASACAGTRGVLRRHAAVRAGANRHPEHRGEVNQNQYWRHRDDWVRHQHHPNAAVRYAVHSKHPWDVRPSGAGHWRIPDVRSFPHRAPCGEGPAVAEWDDRSRSWADEGQGAEQWGAPTHSVEDVRHRCEGRPRRHRAE